MKNLKLVLLASLTMNIALLKANVKNEWVFPETGRYNYKVMEWSGERCLYMNRMVYDGSKADVAYLNDLEFQDGIIEFDIASPSDKSYIGFVFRLKDENNYECVYLRCHGSGTTGAMQYMPVNDTVFNWWDYKDEKFKGIATVPANKWFHVKAEINGDELKVWGNGSEKPNMHYKGLGHDVSSGKIGFLLGNSPDACFANLKINGQAILFPETTGFGIINLEEWKVDEPDSVLVEKVNYWGKEAVYIKKLRAKDKDKIGDALYLKDFEFQNGTIECDIAAAIYMGIAFRAQDGCHFECIYFRPFNSGTEKHDKTVQYVAKGTKFSWYYLRKNFPGKYEAGADIKRWQWFHVKLEVKDKNVRVYVNDNPEPVLVVNDMKYGNSKGSVGFWTWDGYYANLKITKD